MRARRWSSSLPRLRCSRAALLACAAAIAVAQPATARAQATAYVPLDDIAYRYADALIARGALDSLSLLERPYTAGALLAASARALAAARDPVVRSYLIALRTALERYGEAIPGEAPREEEGDQDDDAARAFASGDLFATGETSGQRDLMQPTRDPSATAGGALRLGFEAGPLVALVRPVIDNRLNHDPDFAGRKDRRIAGRTEDAYVAAQWRYAELFLGRIVRNWGPYPVAGLALGSTPYSYDQFFVRAGNDMAHVSALAAKLDDAFLPSGVYARYFYSHRLGVRWRGLEVAASESFLATGIGRSYDISLLNPLNIYALSWRNERASGNLNLGGDLALRTRHFGVYAAQLLLDDIQIDRCRTVCREPSSYGLTVTAEGVPLVGAQRLFASYTRLTGLAYRSSSGPERTYASFGVGLGRGFSDYDESRLGLDLAVIPYVTARIYGAYRRQGEGDYRLAFPPPSEYAALRGFLLGIVERTVRGGVSAGAMLAPGLELTGDLGLNRVANAGHVAGMARTRPEGRVQLRWTPRTLVF